MDCTHYNGYNGNKTEYLLQYEAEENGDTQTRTAVGKQATISHLMSSTNYSIKVAAVNSAGIGELSPAIMTATQPSECKHD